VKRWLRVAAAAAVVVALVVAAGAAVVLALVGRDPGASAQGQLVLAGLSANARIVRDPFGIPHVDAANLVDAYRALGFAHAQDRLWQMEVLRRSARGRLAEIVGPRALDADRLARTLGFGDAADREEKDLSRDTRAALDAYAAGVNVAGGVAATRAAPLRAELARAESSRGARPIRSRSRGRAWNFAAPGASLCSTGSFRLGSAVARFLPGAAERRRARSLAPLLELGRARTASPRPLASRPAAASASWCWRFARGRKPLLANDAHADFSAPAVFYCSSGGAPELSGATCRACRCSSSGPTDDRLQSRPPRIGVGPVRGDARSRRAAPLRAGRWRKATLRREE
jgi:penicillin amidase